MPKALFLDRDGTINIDYGYVHTSEKFEFIPEIFELCKLALNKGYIIIVVTNQSGIERGYYSEDQFKKVTNFMLQKFTEKDIVITDVFFCPSLTGSDRKPAPGMFLKAKEKYNIEMDKSISVGDKHTDILAAENAGCKKNFLYQGSFKEVLKAL